QPRWHDLTNIKAKPFSPPTDSKFRAAAPPQLSISRTDPFYPFTNLMVQRSPLGFHQAWKHRKHEDLDAPVEAFDHDPGPLTQCAGTSRRHLRRGAVSAFSTSSKKCRSCG